MIAPLLSRLMLIDPARVRRNLDRVRASGLLKQTPNEWQVTLGVLRMWHRMLYRSDTVGTCEANPVRDNWRARLLLYRPIRFPFLLAEKAVTPWDFSGLFSSPERVISHLLGAHHDGAQFVYDLQMLACYPGALAALHTEVKALLERDDARTRWLRDLVVFEHYHEALLAAVEDALAGQHHLTEDQQLDPDISFIAYLQWCAAQPSSPAETWRALKEGRLSLSSDPHRSRTLVAQAA